MEEFKIIETYNGETKVSTMEKFLVHYPELKQFMSNFSVTNLSFDLAKADGNTATISVVKQPKEKRRNGQIWKDEKCSQMCRWKVQFERGIMGYSTRAAALQVSRVFYPENADLNQVEHDRRYWKDEEGSYWKKPGVNAPKFCDYLKRFKECNDCDMCY